MKPSTCSCRSFVLMFVGIAVNAAEPGAPTRLAHANCQEQSPLPAAKGKASEDLLQKATLHARAGSYAQARQLLVQAVQLLRTAEPQNPTRLARALNSLGAVEAACGWPRRALAYYNESRDLLERQSSDPSQPIGFQKQLLLAESYDGIGTARSALGDYDHAIQAYENAIKRWKELGRCAGQAHQARQSREVQAGRYRSLLNLAAVYRSQGAEDIEVFDASARRRVSLVLYYRVLAEEIAKDLGKEHPCLTEAHLGLADLHVRTGNLARAKECVDNARNICGRGNDPSRALTCRHRLATIYYRLRQLDEAEQQWKQLLEHYRDDGNESWAARILACLGDVCCRKRRWDAAEAYYRQCLDLLDRRLPPPVLHFNAKFGLAFALCHGGEATAERAKQNEAVSSLKEAVTIVEAASAQTTGAERQRDVFCAQFTGAYELLVKLLLQQGEVEPALFYVEKFRSRTLCAELELAGVDLLSTLPPEHLQQCDCAGQIKRLRQQLAQLRWEMETGTRARSATPGAEAERLQKQLLGWLTHVRDENPLCRRAAARTQSYHEFISDLAALTPTRSIILYYYLGSTQSFLWLITSGGVECYELTILPEHAKELFGDAVAEDVPLTRDLVEELVHRLYGHVYRRPDSKHLGQAPRPATREIGPAKKVEDIDKSAIRTPPPPTLLKPYTSKQALAITEAILPSQFRELAASKGYEQVIVVPDGALHRLPFQALPVELTDPEQLRFVIDEPEFPPVSYVPSLAAAAQLKLRASQPHDKTKKLTICDLDLPFSEDESRAMTACFPREEVISLFGELATEEAFREFAPQCSIIHAPVHAEYQRQNDNIGGLLRLFHGERGGPCPAENDGRLELHEILTLSLLGCQIVVLSGCETKVASPRYLETGNSLAKGFLAAGSTRVVASFWPVNDRSTERLMSTFFQQVGQSLENKTPVDYAAALQTAMRRLRNTRDPTRDWSSPYFWAPFALLGPSK